MDNAAEAIAPPMSTVRGIGVPSGADGIDDAAPDRLELRLAQRVEDARGGRQRARRRDVGAFRARGGRQAHPVGEVGDAGGDPLLETERRMEADKVRPEAGRVARIAGSRGVSGCTAEGRRSPAASRRSRYWSSASASVG